MNNSSPHRLQTILKVLRFFAWPPRNGLMALRKIWHAHRGFLFTETWQQSTEHKAVDLLPDNPLLAFFNARKKGRGIWKWTHYFEIYQQFLSSFSGTAVHFLEIGIYSGGSLDMWASYLGKEAKIYGVDIEPACQQYANEQISIFIGDQAKRNFWQDFKSQVPRLDVVIDDGGHSTQQQITSLEELLPHLSPGGVYIIEDIHGENNLFAGYLYGLQQQLNAADFIPGEDFKTKARPFQTMIHAIHLYPYMAVIQKRKSPLVEFPSPRHGTQWQPFYDS